MHRIRVLLVDDNLELFLKFTDQKNSKFKITFCSSTRCTRKKILEGNFQLVIINYDLQSNNGFGIFKRIQAGYHGPIIFLSSSEDANLRIQGLEMGADAFIQMPCDFKELQLRILKILKHLNAGSNIIVGDYEIDNIFHRIRYRGEDLKLATMPYRLLTYILNHPNEDLSRERLLYEVWGYDTLYGKRVIDTNINLIRQLTQDGNIKSIHGVGYRFTLKD